MLVNYLYAQMREDVLKFRKRVKTVGTNDQEEQPERKGVSYDDCCLDGRIGLPLLP